MNFPTSKNAPWVVLGDSWISPEDYTFSWGPLLKDMSRLDDKGLLKSNTIAKRIQRQIQSAQFVAATSSWSELEDVISSSSNDVDFYNFLLDTGADSVASVTGMDMSNGVASLRRYSRYLSSVTPTAGGDNVDLSDFMNRIIRKKLKIIPDNVTSVPVDQPCVALEMVGAFTRSPAAIAHK
ncbi:Serine carboxypeptidase-like 51, partial [Cucurbita argyrosperma subsp. sororia]